MDFDTMHVSAFQRSRRSLKLFSEFNTLQFASVMALVVFVLLLIFMTETRPHGGMAADLPKVLQPVPMQGANREDAMTITIFRDGKVFFRSDQVIGSEDLQRKISEYLKDPEVERKVYIRADMRVYWGTVKRVLESIRSAGILRVAFLTDQRKAAKSTK